MEQLLDDRADFPREEPTARDRRVFLAEHPAAQRFTTVGMRRTPGRVVPGRRLSVADLRHALLPGPGFDEGVHPQVQMPRPEVRPEVTDLLLSIVTTQVPKPVHAPLHSEKVQPRAAVGVRVTSVP